MSTILLIDSSLNNLDNHTEYFEMEGFNILTAKNGYSAVEMAQRFTPDLIISEILVKGISGYDVLSLLLNAALTRHIPFIFYTSKCEAKDKILAFKLGADDYLVKPGSMELLFAMANQWIKSGTRRN